jgi:Flp pilus assembly protein CpaB
MASEITGLSLRGPTARFVIALVMGCVAMGLLYFREEQILLERSGGPRVPVLIATADVKAGGRVEAKSIGIQEIPRAYVHADAIQVHDQDKIVGRRVYRTVRQNQPFMWGEFDAPASEASLTLQKGLRVTPLPLGELARTRFLMPGDYLDIVVHLSLRDVGTVTTTVLQRVQVLELLGGSAMVALTPEQIELLVFARANGSVTLALRGREDVEHKTLPHLTLEGMAKDLNLPLVSPVKPKPAEPPEEAGRRNRRRAP